MVSSIRCCMHSMHLYFEALSIHAYVHPSRTEELGESEVEQSVQTGAGITYCAVKHRARPLKK
eukprot:812110-Karenia_brevis.AAC.1